RLGPPLLEACGDPCGHRGLASASNSEIAYADDGQCTLFAAQPAPLVTGGARPYDAAKEELGRGEREVGEGTNYPRLTPPPTRDPVVEARLHAVTCGAPRDPPRRSDDSAALPARAPADRSLRAAPPRARKAALRRQGGSGRRDVAPESDPNRRTTR